MVEGCTLRPSSGRLDRLQEGWYAKERAVGRPADERSRTWKPKRKPPKLKKRQGPP